MGVDESRVFVRVGGRSRREGGELGVGGRESVWESVGGVSELRRRKEKRKGKQKKKLSNLKNERCTPTQNGTIGIENRGKAVMQAKNSHGRENKRTGQRLDISLPHLFSPTLFVLHSARSFWACGVCIEAQRVEPTIQRCRHRQGHILYCGP